MKRNLMRTMSKKSKRMMKKRGNKSRRSRSYRRSHKIIKGGGAPTSYVGSIQGEFINDRGQQLFRNPVGGIA